MGEICDDDEVKMYFPEFTDKQRPERKHLLDVLSTIRSKNMHKFIKYCHQSRTIYDEIENSEVIEIKQDHLNEIMMTNYN